MEESAERRSAAVVTRVVCLQGLWRVGDGLQEAASGQGGCRGSGCCGSCGVWAVALVWGGGLICFMQLVSATVGIS